MSTNQRFIRLVLIVFSVTALHCLWSWFAAKPMPMAVIIPATIPLWVVVFVIRPMLKDRKSGPNTQK